MWPMSSVRPSACGWPSRSLQRLVVGQRLDQHPGLGLEAQHDPVALGVLEHALAAVDQEVPGALRRLVGRRRAGPHRDDGRPELDRDVDRRAQQLDAPQPALGQQRREVLAARVEHEPRPGLDHHRQPSALRSPRAGARRAREAPGPADRSGCGRASARCPRTRSRPAARARPRSGGRTARWRHSRTAGSRHRPLPRGLAGERPQRRDTRGRDERRRRRRAGPPRAGSSRGRPRRPRAACAPARGRPRRRRVRGRRSRRRRRPGRARRHAPPAVHAGSPRRPPRPRPPWPRVRAAGRRRRHRSPRGARPRSRPSCARRPRPRPAAPTRRRALPSPSGRRARGRPTCSSRPRASTSSTRS